MTLEEAIRHAEEKAKRGGKCGEDHAQLAEWLKELRERRAAEPEKRTKERTETHACDCISRAAAIDAMMKLQAEDDEAYGCRIPEGFDGKRAKEALESLPSAQPERKTGRWVDGQCSNCGCDTPAYIIDWKWQKDMDANYCPNCGAYMGGEQNETD